MGFIDSLLAKASGIETEAKAKPNPTDIPPEPAEIINSPKIPQPVETPKKYINVAKGAYLSHPHLPLVQLSKNDYLTIEDAYRGIQIFGSNGSGKTSGSGQTLAKAYLRAGFGGLVLCAKPDECENWMVYAKACGRDKQVIHVSPESQWRFNFIEYELKRPSDPATRVENILSTLMVLMEQSGRDSSGGGDDKFWHQAAEQLLRYSLMVLTAARSHYDLFDLQRFIDTIPKKGTDADSEVIRDGPFYKALNSAKEAYHVANRVEDYQVIEHYFLSQFSSLAERTRSSIIITLSTMLQDLLTGTLRELFSTGSNFFPEDSHEGAIIIIDLPTIQNRANITAQVLFKTVWQQAALRRMYDKSAEKRPIFLWVDESHFFVTQFDTGYQSLARQACAATVYLTQNLSSYYQRMGGAHPENAANALLAYLPTQIFHAQNDRNTMEYMINLFGDHEVRRYNETQSTTKGTNWSENQSSGFNSSATTPDSGPGSSTFGMSNTYGESWGESFSDSRGHNVSVTIEKMLRAHHITSLTTGSDDVDSSQKHLRGIAQAWIFRNGSTWSNRQTHMLAQFNRRLA